MEERFEVKSSYNLIKGIVRYPEGEGPFPAIIFSHGLLSSKDSEKYVRLAEVFSKEGFLTLRFDYHGSGESEGNIGETNVTIRLENLRAVYNYLILNGKVDISRIGILGSSLGGTLALIFSSAIKEIRALCVLATPYRIEGRRPNGSSEPPLNDQFYRDFAKYDVLKSSSSLMNTLVIHGERDEVVDISHAFKIFNALLPPKRIEILKDGDHTLSHETVREDMIRSSLAWFKRFM